MATLPIRRKQFSTGEFANWLVANGGELGKPTNCYEVIRYRAYNAKSRKPLTHIVYAKDNGLLNWQGDSREHYQAFLDGKCMTSMFIPMLDRQILPGEPDPDKPSDAAKRRAKLLERDGDECWFCGLALGDDVTVEHLVPKSAGGENKLANYALAHAACNHRAADMPLIKKIELRAKMRADALPAVDMGEK